MFPAESHRLVTLRHYTTLVVPDAFYKYAEGGPKQPLQFVQPGQLLNLDLVDAESYVRSSLYGMLRDFTDLGYLARVPVLLSEKREAELNHALAVVQSQKQGVAMPVAPPVTNPGNHTSILQIEPGLYVGVGAGGGAPAAPPMNAGAAVPVPVVPEPVAPEAAKPAADPQAPDEPMAPWKANKTLKEQEDFLKSSEDRELLSAVVADEKESARMKKIAKKVLESIGG